VEAGDGRSGIALRQLASRAGQLQNKGFGLQPLIGSGNELVWSGFLDSFGSVPVFAEKGKTALAAIEAA
jgi:hypothetical protein